MGASHTSAAAAGLWRTGKAAETAKGAKWHVVFMFSCFQVIKKGKETVSRNRESPRLSHFGQRFGGAGPGRIGSQGVLRTDVALLPSQLRVESPKLFSR